MVISINSRSKGDFIKCCSKKIKRDKNYSSPFYFLCQRFYNTPPPYLCYTHVPQTPIFSLSSFFFWSLEKVSISTKYFPSSFILYNTFNIIYLTLTIGSRQENHLSTLIVYFSRSILNTFFFLLQQQHLYHTILNPY